ncbi:MAG: hypothetical protein WDN46_03420 [Methylocella sp.]
MLAGALALGSIAAAWAQTPPPPPSTLSEILALINGEVIDNNSGQITPAIVRDILTNMAVSTATMIGPSQLSFSQLPQIDPNSVLCNATRAIGDVQACETLPSGLIIPSPTITGSNVLPLGLLSQIPANSLLGNPTESTGNVVSITALPSGFSIPSPQISSPTISSPTINGAAVAAGTLFVQGQLTAFVPSTGDFLGSNPFSGGKYAFGNVGNVLAESGPSGVGVTGAGRTLDTTGSAFGAIFFGFNDKPSALNAAFAQYGECRIYPGAASCSVGEWNITDFRTSGSVGFDSYNLEFASGHGSAGLRLLSGGGCLTVPGQICLNVQTGLYDALPQPAGAALGIQNNGATFLKGIFAGYNALQGNDGMTPGQSGTLMQFPRGSRFKQQYCDNTASYPANCTVDLIGAFLSFEVDNAASVQDITIGDNGLIIQNGGGGINLIIPTSNIDVNGFEFLPSAAGAPIILEPQGFGGDANVTLEIGAKGTGVIDLLSPLELSAASFTANGTVATTITSLGPTGASTTIKEWLTVLDTTGAKHFIPSY